MSEKICTLDKSLPYKELVMRIQAKDVRQTTVPILPQGYAFRFYQPGDGKRWAKIETSVDEFPDEASAYAYFEREFLPFETELSRRMLFVLDANGRVVGTATAWHLQEDEKKIPLMHWVSVMPSEQGKGIGRALIVRALHIFSELSPGQDVYLKTQTWSHPAVGLYLRIGFRAMNEHHPILASGNEYSEACEILRNVMSEDMYRLLTESENQ